MAHHQMVYHLLLGLLMMRQQVLCYQLALLVLQQLVLQLGSQQMAR
jgi:hypothetical protein